VFHGFGFPWLMFFGHDLPPPWNCRVANGVLPGKAKTGAETLHEFSKIFSPPEARK
jgi:hypothetical protein